MEIRSKKLKNRDFEFIYLSNFLKYGIILSREISKTLLKSSPLMKSFLKIKIILN